MSNDDTDDERALRSHIHGLLDEYAFEHLTTDYDQFTRDAVFELLSDSLGIIPLHDKNAIRLPADPWERLNELHGLQTRLPYQEKFQITSEVSKYLRTAMKMGHGPSPTERIAKDCMGDIVCRAQERICSTLSLKANKATPQPGSGHFLKSLPKSHEVAPVSVPHIQEDETSQDELLNLTWRLQTEEHLAVSTLLKSAAILSRPGPKYKNQFLDPQALLPSPDLHIREDALVPIFPRSGRIRGGTTTKTRPLPDFQSMADLPKMIPPIVKVEDDESDMARENMRVIDGWHVYDTVSSPPSRGSAASSQEDNIDQLFNVPSPDTSPGILFPSKMDVPPIPRNRRIKGSAGSKKRQPATESLSSFLLSHLKPPQQLTEGSKHSSPQPPLSMIVEPSALESEGDLTEDISALCRSVQGGNLKTAIMEEPLNSSESLIMKVPVLSEPNVHPPNALFLAASLSDFLVAAKSKDLPEVAYKFLKKTKGLKALNLTLSWTPFSSTSQLPSNLDVIGSSTLIDEDDMKNGLPKEHIQTEVEALLGSLSLVDEPIQDDARWTLFDSFPKISLESPSNTLDIILSRAERQKDPASGEGIVEGGGGGGSDKENEDVSLGLFEAQFVDSGVAFDLEKGIPASPFPPAKRPRLDAHSEQVYCQEQDPCPADDPQDAFYFSHSLETCPAEADPYAYSSIDIIPQSPTLDAYQPDASPPFSHLNAGPFNHLPFEVQEGLSHTRQRSHQESASPDLAQHQTAPKSNLYDGNCNPQYEPAAPDISSHALGLSDFLRLRSKRFQLPEMAPNKLDAVVTIGQPIIPDVLPTAPPALFDKNTIRLPDRAPPAREHRYMTSIDFVQKFVLMRALRSSKCSVTFVEREHLSGVDLILDANTAIIFTSLVSLSSQREALITNVSEQSWRYTNLLVIFEAYPISCSFTQKGNSDAAFNAYTPPTLKAMGRFRRDLSLAEACEKKRAKCSVYTAFADSVHDAGLLARYFGDMAEQLDATLWGDRCWLEEDVPLEEESLASVPTMNHFAAYVILCQTSVDDFLALTPEERLEKFSILIGEERMASVNSFIDSRTQAMDSSESDSDIHATMA